MDDFVVQISSIHNIDLTAAALALRLFPQRQVVVYLNEHPDVPLDGSHRVHVARGALPLLAWDHDGSVWRQRFWPFDIGAAPPPAPRPWSADEMGLVDPRNLWSGALSNEARDRFGKLVDTANGVLEKLSPTSPWTTASGEAQAALISHIVGELAGREIAVLPYTARHGVELDEFCLAFFWRLVSATDAASPRRLRFIGGGNIEIRTPEEPNWVRITGMKSGGLKGVELTVDGRANSIFIPHQRCESVLTGLRFRGPLELGVLCSMGVPVDLPWYAQARFFEKRPDSFYGVELISPISVSSKLRVAAAVGGGGQRLEPSGYSLLEFDCMEVSGTLARLLRVPIPNFEDLADWRLLISRFPQASQKLSKSQSSVRALRAGLEAESDLPASEVNAIIEFGGSTSDRQPMRYGRVGVVFLRLLLALKQWLFTRGLRVPETEVMDFLERAGWVSASGLSITTVCAKLRAVLEPTVAWLTEMGFDPDRATLIRRTIDQLEMDANRSPTLLFSREGLRSDLSVLGHAIALVRMVVDEYYQFAAFICGGVLKMSSLVAWMVVGPGRFRELIDQLLSRRLRDRLYFEPIFWELE